MRIAYFCHEFPPFYRGGTGRFAEALSKQLIRDHQMSVFSINNGELATFEQFNNLTIYRPIVAWLRSFVAANNDNTTTPLGFASILLNAFLNNFQTFHLFRKLHKQQRFDVAVIQDFTAAPTGILCKLLGDIPVVYHVHTTIYTMSPWTFAKDPLRLITLMEKLMAALADQIIVATPEIKNLAVRHHWDPAKIQVVYCGNTNDILLGKNHGQDDNHAVLAEEIRRNLGIPAGAPVLVFVGRLTEAKGIFTLIKAMPRILARFPDTRLLLLGNGKQSKIDGLVADLGLRKNVIAYHAFLPADQVAAHYKLADVCVFPSVYEPFGMVAIESMALGKATVLGEGFSRIFEGNPASPNAYYSSGSQPCQLADTIIGVLENPREAAQRAERSQSFVKAHFDWDKLAQQNVAVYQMACAAAEHV